MYVYVCREQLMWCDIYLYMLVKLIDVVKLIQVRVRKRARVEYDSSNFRTHGLRTDPAHLLAGQVL